jgi:hypothetical protein
MESLTNQHPLLQKGMTPRASTVRTRYQDYRPLTNLKVGVLMRPPMAAFWRAGMVG